MSGMSRPLARLLATVGLVAAAIAVIWVISASVDDGEEPTEEESGKVTASGCNPKAEAALAAGFYIIKPDENLSLIGERTCIDEEELIDLNPDLDPQALAPGQCLNLEETGCERAEE